jgi:hypothetical protein
MDIVTVASYGLQPEAHLAKNLLEAEGIPAFLSEEIAGDMLHLGNEVKLMVPADRADEARDILQRAERHEFAKAAAAEAEAHAKDKVNGNDS